MKIILLLIAVCICSFIIGRITKKPILLPDKRKVGISVTVFSEDGKKEYRKDIIRVDSRRKRTFYGPCKIDIFFSEITEDLEELKEAGFDKFFSK